MVDSYSQTKPASGDRDKILLETLASLSYRDRNLDGYLQEITKAVSRLLGVEWSVVTCCDRQQYQVIASNLKMPALESSFNLHGSLTGTVVKTGKSLCVADTEQDNQYGAVPPGYRSYLGVPLRVPTGEIIGTVCCFDAKPQTFSAEALRIAELLAERAAIAIDNYNLYQQQQDFNQALEVEVTKRTAQLKTAQAELIEKEKLAAIGQFASTIVHEIRNPTTTILMGLTALEKLDLDRRDRLRLDLAVAEGKRLTDLLKEILLYAKPQKLRMERIELDRLLNDLSFALREMPAAKQRKLQLEFDEAQFFVRGDRNKLKQVIINLVKNAFEAIEVGETVTCSLSFIENGDFCCLSVTNRGTPIPQEILPQLTEPFVSNKPGGTGLGLAIVAQIIQGHGGSLSIESEPEKGTRISFTLPKAINS